MSRRIGDTIERVFAALGAQGLADQLGAYLGRQAGVGPVAALVASPALLPALANSRPPVAAPGVGTGLAAQPVRYRRFTAGEQLARVSGIS